MEIEYREYQQRSINKALEHFKNGDKAVLLEAPVGSGKTIMGLKIVQKLMQTLFLLLKKKLQKHTRR